MQEKRVLSQQFSIVNYGKNEWVAIGGDLKQIKYMSSSKTETDLNNIAKYWLKKNKN